MEQIKMMGGFSELKNMLIQTYRLTSDPQSLKLYFSEKDNQLFKHDYQQHTKAIRICSNLDSKILHEILIGNPKILINETLKYKKPSKFLNDQFKLYGFFRF